jgi:multidrug efflux pump subunit AcrB
MSSIDTKTGIIAWFARNSVAANLLMLILIVGGFVSALSIDKQVFPNFTFNNVIVRVPYLGAAPQEVEEGVIIKIEESIRDIQGIKKITSTASEGLATVNIEVDDDYDPQVVLDEVKVQVDAIQSFPQNIETPVVYRLKPTQDVLWVSVYGDADEKELKEYAKDMRDEIANLPGLSSVEVVGMRDYEISVEVSEYRLQEYDLTFSEVVNAIQSTSLDLPGGSIRSDNGDILLRTKGQAYTGNDFRDITLINRPDGTRLTLGDVASIRDGFVENNGFSLFDGKPSMSIRVQAVDDQNALEISKTVNQYFAR